MVREPRLAEDLFDRKRTARHVGGVFQDPRVAGHEPWRREAEDLPEREVPRHDGQHDAERIERDKALTGLGLHRLGRQKSLGVFRVVVAAGRAFLRLGNPIANRFAHLLCHEARILPSIPAQQLGRVAHEGGTLAEAGRAPPEIGLMRVGDDASHRLG